MVSLNAATGRSASSIPVAARGSTVSIYGNDLARVTLTANSFPLPTVLGGVTAIRPIPGLVDAATVTFFEPWRYQSCRFGRGHQAAFWISSPYAAEAVFFKSLFAFSTRLTVSISSTGRKGFTTHSNPS